MSYPDAYERAYDFQAYQNANPTRPLPGNQVNAELNAIAASQAEFGVFLAGITRADGRLANGIVSADQLDTVLAAALGDLEAIETVEALVAAAQAAAISAASSESVVVDSVAAAAASQSAAAASASSASGSAASATASASSASTSASTATTQAGLAATSRTNAGTSETNAAASASAASTSAGTASTHATTATTQAGNASTSATNANNSAIAAAASAAAASSSFDSFDDRYLGPYASDPALDNDGNALVVGAIYFNTTTGLKIWNGATWMSYSAVSGDMLKSDNLSGLSNYTTARSNMGLVIGTNVQAYDATLAAIAALGTAADKMLYTTGVDTWAELAVTSVGRALLDDTTAAAQRTTLGLVIGTDVQAYDAQLSSLIRQNSQSAAYTLVLTDGGKHILHPAADTTARIFTIPANSSVAFPIGTAVTFVNQNAGGVITIAITTDTMRLAGAGTTGSRTLAANGIATAIKITSTEWIISGTGLT